MSQSDALSVLQNAESPMTASEVAAIIRPNDGPGRNDVTRKDLWNLEKKGLIRRVGTRSPTGYASVPQILWEAVE